MITNKKILCTLFLMVSIPIIFITNDFWDGSIVNYSFRINVLSDLKVWLFETRWNVQYYIYFIVHYFSNVSGLSEEFFLKTLTLLSLFGATLEVKHLSKTLLNLSDKQSYISAYFFLLYPAWHVLVSSIMVIHILCVWLIFLGFRLIVEKRNVIIGLVFVAISLQLNSNFMMLCALILSKYLSDCYIYYEKTYLFKFIFCIFLVVVLFILYKAQFPPYGLYSDYNKINFCIKTIYDIIFSFKRFFQFVLPIVFFPILVLILSKKLIDRTVVVPFLIIFLLILASIFPYATVGKHPYVNDIERWSYRQTLLLGVPFSMLLGYFFAFILKKQSNHKIISVLLIISLVISSVFLFRGFYSKAQSELYHNAFIKALQNIDKPIKSLVHIKLNQKKSNYLEAIADYELNALFQRAYGECGWMAKIDYNNFASKYELSESDKMMLRSEYRNKYLTVNVDTTKLVNLNLEQIDNLSFFDVIFLHNKDLYKISFDSQYDLERVN